MDDGELCGSGTPLRSWHSLVVGVEHWPPSPRELLVQVPYAPRHDENMEDEEAFLFTARQTIGAYRHKFPDRFDKQFPYWTPNLQWKDIWRTHQEIFEVGTMLIRTGRQYPPISWTAFRIYACSEYRQELPGRFMRGLARIYDAEKFVDQHGWFKYGGFFRLGGNVYLLPGGKAYGYAFHTLCTVVESGVDPGEAASAFNTQHTNLFNAALQSKRNREAAYRAQLQQGDFIW